MRRNGFTLLELILVVAIVAILAGAVVGMLEGTQEEASTAAAKSELATIRDALLRFKLDNGRWPYRSIEYQPTDPASTLRFGLAELLLATPIAVAPYSHVAWNPDARRGFRGPYLVAPRAVDEDGNGAPNWLGDPWYRALVAGTEQPDHTFQLVVHDASSPVSATNPAVTELRCYVAGPVVTTATADAYLKVEVR